MKRFLLMLSILLLAAPVPAQGPAASLFPDGYLNHEALGAALRRVAESNPEAVRLGSLAKTGQGRDVPLVAMGRSDQPGPAILIVANLEADHVVGSQVALGLVERLAGSAPDSDVGRFLEHHRIYVVPRLNPDGAGRYLAMPLIPMRTNLRPVDRDRDGRSGEDGPDDLNGDGVATRLRVKDGKATLVPDAKDARVLRRANPAAGERGIYSEYGEGIDNDGDGLIDEDPAGGVNLNRNWPHQWTEFDPEAGFSPAGEPETRALIQFIFDHPEIVVIWSFGLNDNLRSAPQKPGSTLDDADLSLFVEFSKLFNAAAPGGSAGQRGTTDGSLAEWAYHQFGVVGLASRLWGSPEIPDPPEGQPKPPGDGEARWLYWNDHVMGGKAFVPFAPFDHPTLGKVEVGGWRPGVRINPPVERVGAITDSHLAFLTDLAKRLPKLEVREVKVEAKGGGIYLVSAVVENAGYLPTALAQGVRTRKADPILVRLKAEGARFLAGRALERVESLAGSGGRREFRWLLDAPETVKTITLDVSCPKAGRVSKEVELK